MEERANPTTTLRVHVGRRSMDDRRMELHFFVTLLQEYCEGPLKDAAYHFDFKGGELAT